MKGDTTNNYPMQAQNIDKLMHDIRTKNIRLNVVEGSVCDSKCIHYLWPNLETPCIGTGVYSAKKGELCCFKQIDNGDNGC